MPQSPNRFSTRFRRNFRSHGAASAACDTGVRGRHCRNREPIRNVYFPFTGVISLVVEMNVGEMIETAMVGRDGVVNGTSALDGKIHCTRASYRLPVHAVMISPDVFENSPMNLIRYSRYSSGTSKCCLPRRNSRPVATPVTRSRPACADGCCGCETWPNAMI